MEELKRTRRITIAAVIAIIVLAAAFFSYTKPLRYQLSAEDMAYELMMVYHVSPDEAMELMWDSSTVFVDIRGYYDFTADHLDNAVNIEAAKLLDEDNLSLFDQWQQDSVQVVLYGNTELEVTSPWMILYQLGYTNTKVMMGGMEFINQLYSDDPPEADSYNVEAPLFDYAGIIEAATKANSGEMSIQPQKKVIIRKKEKKAAEGGC